MEGLREHIVGDRRRRSKDSIADGDNARVLAAEASDGHSVGGPVVVLVVDETLREHEHVALVKNLGVVLVLRVGGHKANEKAAFQHDEDLGGARVGVWWVKAKGRIVDANQGDAQRVQPGNLSHTDRGHLGADGIRSVTRLVEATEEEIVDGDHLCALTGEAIDQSCNCKDRTLHAEIYISGTTRNELI